MIATSPIPTAALEGRAIGALVMAGFGALWIVIAAKLLKRLDWRAWLVVALITGILCIGAVKQLHVASHVRHAFRLGDRIRSSYWSLALIGNASAQDVAEMEKS